MSEERRPEPVASFDGFSDSTGRTMTYEEGLREAARCIMDQGETDYVAELLRERPPTEVLEWLVYPDTGAFPK
jgi:hypothetical protein